MKETQLNFKELYQIYTKKYPEVFKFYERQKFVSYVYIILTLFTVSFFGIFAIMPTLSTITALNKQKADNEFIYESLKVKLANLQQLDQLYAANAQTIQQVETAIPPTAQIPTVVKKIETLAQQNNLFISNIVTGSITLFPTAEKDPPLYSYTVNMSLVGDSANINTFISQVINFDRIIGIEAIGSGTTNENRSEVVITGRVFFYATE
ncbi:MAG TPA: type 4a pilus biogenesis protein PilO [Candidatus Levybacteria bacterium]|nr:type 4a pilus biogenesis protein PilO [Candidatus Levybacteria bacterium]